MFSVAVEMKPWYLDDVCEQLVAASGEGAAATASEEVPTAAEAAEARDKDFSGVNLSALEQAGHRCHPRRWPAVLRRGGDEAVVPR